MMGYDSKIIESSVSGHDGALLAVSLTPPRIFERATRCYR